MPPFKQADAPLLLHCLCKIMLDDSRCAKLPIAITIMATLLYLYLPSVLADQPARTDSDDGLRLVRQPDQT